MTSAPALAAALVLAAGACGGAATGGRVALVDAWIRPTPPVTNVGAFYLRIVNGSATDDRVVGASSPHCAEVEIHQTDTDDDGVASMRLAEGSDLLVAAGEDLVFEPSGLHVMCLGLDQPVVDGARLSLTVELAEIGPLTVEAAAENR